MAGRIALASFLAALLVISGWTITAGGGPGADPMAQVKSAVARAQKLLGDPAYKTAPESRRDELLKILDGNFDFEAMARSSLGAYWNKLDNRQRERYVSLFHQRLERRYVKIIEDYSAARINFVRESRDGPDRAEVYTNVVNPMLAEPLQLNYMLKRGAGGWKVYDISIAGISEVDSYRKEYAQIINTEGFSGLLEKLSGPPGPS